VSYDDEVRRTVRRAIAQFHGDRSAVVSAALGAIPDDTLKHNGQFIRVRMDPNKVVWYRADDEPTGA
jgi:hypothetical protein